LASTELKKDVKCCRVEGWGGGGKKSEKSARGEEEVKIGEEKEEGKGSRGERKGI